MHSHRIGRFHTNRCATRTALRSAHGRYWQHYRMHAKVLGVETVTSNTIHSFVWPAYFHLRLRGESLNALGRSRNYSIMALGFLFGTIGLYYRQVLK